MESNNNTSTPFQNQIGNYPIKVLPLGGMDEMGKNCYIIEVEEDAFIIEAGLKYPANSMPGVDFIIPDFTYIKDISNRIKAIIITHGHDDQYGALPYLLNYCNAPIYATETTIAVIKSTYEKFKKITSADYHIVNPSDTITIANHVFELFQTTHSISQSFGFALRTRFGNIVYTSDFISDYSPLKGYKFDLPKVARLSENEKTFLLMTESESADLPGISSPNHKITEMIKNEIEEPTGKVFISIYNQNFYNIQEVVNLAIKYGRKICIANIEQIAFFENMIKIGALNIPNNLLIPLNNINTISPKDLIVLVSGSGDKLYSLCKEICYGNVPYLKVETTDTWINCAPSVPGTEVEAVDTSDAIFRTDCHVLTLSRKEVFSMHARQEDLKMMISLFRPKYYLPIKGEFRLLMANAKLAIDLGIGLNHFNTFVFDNGMALAFDETGNVVHKNILIRNGDVLVDGRSVGDVKEQAIDERTKMADGGVVVIGLVVSLKDKAIKSEADIQMRGFIYLKESETLVKQINNLLFTTIQNLFDNSEKNLTISDLVKKSSDKIARYIEKTTEKEPMVYINIIDENNLDQIDPH